MSGRLLIIHYFLLLTWCIIAYNILMHNTSRLSMLADGIFAIVITLLVLEIKVPHLSGASNDMIVGIFIDSYPLFLAYFVSFATLFTYWRGYHAVATDFVRTHNHNFENLSAAFLFFVALVPFSSHLLGVYHRVPAAVAVFAMNICVIGLFLLWMREYAHRSKEIKNKRTTESERRHGRMRITIPIVFSLVATVLAFVDTDLSLSILTIAIVFNLLKKSTRALEKIIDPAIVVGEKKP